MALQWNALAYEKVIVNLTPAVLANFRPVQKSLPGTNTTAYFDIGSGAKKKSL